MSTPRSTLIRRVLVVVAIALAASSCAADVVKDYGDQAKLNFVGACTTERSVTNGKLTVTQIAGTNKADQVVQTERCTCIYNYISNKKHMLDFGDLTAYEAKVADAADGAPPKVPKLLTKAINACPVPTNGPSVPKSTSTTSTTTG